jgi:FSR family fosmidomycin resistance protein-like MFS transporter
LELLNRYWQRLLLLAFGHGLNDFTAGYMLGSLLYFHTNTKGIVAGFLVYNLLAFGGQYFVVLLSERIANNRLLLTAAAISNCIALTLFPMVPHLSLLLAGCASAVYHVAGGACCLNENKAASIGIFAAPGIIGLALAGYAAYLKLDLWLELILVCTAFVLLLQVIAYPVDEKKDPSKEPAHPIVDEHDVLMIVLLGIISLRSAVWNIFQMAYEHNYSWLLAIAFSAFAGKIIGGWISDRIGWKLYGFVSLIAAMPLVSFFKQEIILFCIGIGLLQSAIPANTALMIRYCRGNKEKGIAFSFGLAVIAGVFLTAPVKLFSVNHTVYWLMSVLLVFTVMLLIKKRFFAFKTALSN